MKQNNHKSLLLVIAMISLLVGQLLFLVGCATPKKDWEKAQRLNTIEAYEEFLQKHPDSEFAYKAKRKIEEIDCGAQLKGMKRISKHGAVGSKARRNNKINRIIINQDQN